MSKRILRNAGTTTAQTLQTNKNYKFNSAGSLVEATTIGDDDIVFSGSKSSLRRLADIERNVSILAAKALTEDGSSSGYYSTIDYANRAGKWANARTITLAGDLSGNVSIDGSQNVTLTATVAANSVALGTDTTGNYMVNVSAGTGISVSHTQGEGSTATVALNATTDNVGEGATNLYFTNARAVSANTTAIATAKSEAISAAAADATTKANAAQAAAIAAVTNGAGAAFDTLVEIQNAMATDAELSAAIAAITTVQNANQLTTARLINGVSFNGTANVTVTTAGTGISVSGTTVTNTLSTSGGAIGGAIAVSGAITATGEVTAYFSDLRLKTNIVQIPDALEKVEALNGVTFDPNEAALALGIEARHQMGVIAQEVEAVAPELVCDSAFAGYKTVRYDKLTALLIEAVKELSAKVKTLEAKLGDTKPQL